MEKRCNQLKDCSDGSDEIATPAGYQKDKPAPPKQDKAIRNSVKININLESIQSISENDNSIVFLFNLEMYWWDPRLSFQNLKIMSELNILTNDENKMIWVPTLVFKNTQSKLVSLNDQKTVIYVEREGQFFNSDISVLENIEIFSGAENPITMSRMYNMEFMCEYQLHMYPFDTQTCQITMTKDIRIQRMGSSATLVL